MRLEHHLVGGYVRYISPYIIILLLAINQGQSWISGENMAARIWHNSQTSKRDDRSSGYYYVQGVHYISSD